MEKHCYYYIEVKEEDWRHNYGTQEYSKFFDEAAKVIDRLLPSSVAPATLTELPALENGEMESIEKSVSGKTVKFGVWEYDS